MHPVKLRPALSSDAPALAIVHVDTWRAAYQGLLPEGLLASLDVDAREQMWREVLASGGTAHVAEVDDEIVGFSSYGPSRDDDAGPLVGELLAIYVRPARWGTGVGRQLHDRAVLALSTSGMTEATLWVLDGNDRARGFYERQRWTSDGHTRADEIAGVSVPEVRYRLALRKG